MVDSMRQRPEKLSPAFRTLSEYMSEGDGAHVRSVEQALRIAVTPEDKKTAQEAADKIKSLYSKLNEKERAAFASTLNTRRQNLVQLIGEDKVGDTRSSFAHFLEGEDRDITSRRYILKDLNFLATLLGIDNPTR
jgi:aspartate ammonia-lyase